MTDKQKFPAVSDFLQLTHKFGYKKSQPFIKAITVQ